MTLGPDLLLDEDHDLAIVEGDLVIGVSVAQAVKIATLWILGEWFENTREGVPYFEYILVKAPDIPRVTSIFRSTILGVLGVGELEKLEVSYDPATRALNITWQAGEDEGEIDFNVGAFAA